MRPEPCDFLLEHSDCTIFVRFHPPPPITQGIVAVVHHLFFVNFLLWSPDRVDAPNCPAIYEQRRCSFFYARFRCSVEIRSFGLYIRFSECGSDTLVLMPGVGRFCLWCFVFGSVLLILMYDFGARCVGSGVRCLMCGV